MHTINILHSLLLAWFLAYFEPLQFYIKTYIKPFITNEYIKTALSCFKCISFYCGLFICVDIFDAIAASIIAYTYEKIMNSFKLYI